MARSQMFPSYIFPTVLTLIGLIGGAVVGPMIQDLLMPEKEVSIKLSEPAEVLTSRSVGNRDYKLFDQKVNASYLSTIELKNVGKTSIDNYLFTIDVDTDKEPLLYRFFYTTEPPHTFGVVKFSNVGPASKNVVIDRFIEGNQLNVSVISSEPLAIDIIPNTSGVMSTVKPKDIESSYTMEDIVYVVVFSVLFAFLLRAAYDFIPWAVNRCFRKSM
ncbi:hypothetical protein ACED51_10665 [Photobacterium swingsii]|uniref:hypothetical protein n=1 Tax=Photobacterium swingsii TaxID=680026 RepID=UPI00352D0FF2